MPVKLPSLSQCAALLLSGAAYAALAYATPRVQFGQLVGLFAVAGLAYWWLLRTRLPLRWGLGAALMFRLLWLPAMPALSDDLYRFRWDGLLVANGVNPFRFRPDELIADGARTAVPREAARAAVLPELQQLYRQLNSPHYYSVYPPICQFVFGTAAKLFPTSDAGFAACLRVVILAAEVGTAWLLLALLPALGWPARRALSYLLHPLVVVELTGNLHFEGLVFGFILLAIWLLSRQKWAGSAVALGLGVATKLLPLLVLPLLVRRLGGRRFAAYAALCLGTVALLFGPFLSVDLFINIARSLKLYFRSFEFNASLYYLLRPIGIWLTTYNQIAIIGPGLAILSGLAGLALAWRERRRELASLVPTLLLMLTAYYAAATTVHPWYLTLLVGLSTLTHFRYARVWGGLAVLSYAAYQTSAYSENLWLVALEYAGTYAVLAWELRATWASKRTGAAL
ncbi:glycosyltransferase 87 family protein [Hymenobacter convexus]|uniref:glycosyltransferase 87 family protein n=1 Tax=Hymenobacter sp. CA1UV-4 TaxID=3063782 RepID=UPI002712FD39|nr:glycosyltransferase 87 family protein [Hymenobacter sp. CA1UV-4]MDO7852435.1 glycosyltransferase 87 family protein [Hymenobacter sp. CA1UV-4]